MSGLIEYFDCPKRTTEGCYTTQRTLQVELSVKRASIKEAAKAERQRLLSVSEDILTRYANWTDRHGPDMIRDAFSELAERKVAEIVGSTPAIVCSGLSLVRQRCTAHISN